MGYPQARPMPWSGKGLGIDGICMTKTDYLVQEQVGKMLDIHS